MTWFVLFLAGLFEVAWAIGLKYSHGFTKPGPSLFTAVFMVASVYLLGIAARTIPLGTAYGVWVGIGAIGAAIAGIVLFQEGVSPLRVVSLFLVLLGVVGLKLSAQTT